MDFQRTVETTVAVLEFVHQHAPQARVVYPSSAGVYGLVNNLPIKETTALDPISPYGEHKKIAEEVCQSYSRHFGISVAIVRLFSVYGIGLRKQLLWDACVKICNGENTFFGSGLETRDLLHVNDAAALLLVAGMLEAPGCNVINGGSGKGITVREILNELFACFGSADAPQFSGVSRNGDPVNYIADISKAESLGWKPSIAWRNGLHEYAKWFKNGSL
jgi:UDP-glucose 4-epimerase